jgi:parvulin-like peptidyl-prolyl isomerase
MLIALSGRVFSRLFSVVLALCLLGCESGDPSLLARVGEREVRVADLAAFERGLDVGDSLSIEDHRDYLTTLIDRELLLVEARALALEKDEKYLGIMERDSEQKLAEMMFNQEVADRSEPTPSEIEAAYNTGDWNRQAVSVELFLPDIETALRVREEILNGLDIYEAGRLYSVDRLMHIPMGGVQQFIYNIHDGPEEVVQRVFQIPEGNLSSPIPLFKGYVIAYVAEYRKVTKEQVEGEIVRYIRKEKRRLLRGAYLQQLNKSLDLSFSPEGLERAVRHLAARKENEDLALPADSNQVVYSFADTSIVLAQVVREVGTSSRRWPTVDSETLVAEIKNTVLPELLMAANARQRGVDQSPNFLAWQKWRSEDLLLSLLRSRITDDIEVSEEEINRHYQQIKRRFRIPGYARLRDVLVATKEEADQLKQAVDEGADFPQIIQEHTLRKGSKRGVYRVFALQANQYGTAWMNYVLNVPIGTIHGPVEAEGGYSLLQVVERTEDSYYGLEEQRVYSAVSRDIERIKERTQFNRFLAEVRQRYSAQVERFEDALVAFAKRS